MNDNDRERHPPFTLCETLQKLQFTPEAKGQCEIHPQNHREIRLLMSVYHHIIITSK